MSSSVQVLDRALDILELLATSENGLSITDISTHTGLPKSTVHRILSSYCQRDYIIKDANSIYSLGYKFVELASLYLNKIDLKTEATPFMYEMATVFNATAYLGVLENDEVVYLQKTEQHHSLRLYTSIGKREPLYCTGLGKVLMAALPEEEFEQIGQRLSYKPYTDRSITNFEDLKKEVDFAREHGYGRDYGEHTKDSSCIAVPVYDYTGKVIAALSISGFGLLNNFSEEEIYEKLSTAARNLSERMGYSAPRE